MNTNKVFLPFELFSSAIILMVALIANLNGFRGFSLLLFIASGIFHGIYYGKNNHFIFHFPYKDDYYKKLSEDGDLKGFQETWENHPNSVLLLNNDKANSNSLWVHLVCSFTASIALYLLSIRVNILEPLKFIRHAELVDFILFVIVLIGYCGLLPMTVWFFANTGRLLEKFNKSPT